MKDKWIGLAHVKPRPGNDFLDGAEGAFVPAVGLALDESEFVRAVTSALNDYDFDVVEIKDIERWHIRQKKFNVASEICNLVGGLSGESPIALASFDAYDSS